MPNDLPYIFTDSREDAIDHLTSLAEASIVAVNKITKGEDAKPFIKIVESLAARLIIKSTFSKDLP